MPSNPWLRLEYLTEREDAELLLPCVRPLYEEVGVVPFSPEKSLRQIIEVLDRGFVLTVKDARYSHIIGTLGLLPVDCWYGDGDVLIDLWFYVAEDHRDGAAQELLMAEAAAISEESRLPLLITCMNVRRRRIPRTPLEITATKLGYLPGRVLSVAR